MSVYTLTEISKKSGLSKREIRKHLVAQTLKGESVSSGYKIDDKDLDLWLKNIPSIDAENLDSIFSQINLNKENVCDEYYEINISKFKRNNNWKSNKLKCIKFADFFCGAGGISLGLVMAGFEPVLGVEIDAFAYETYISNLGERFKKLKDFPTLDITDPNNKRMIIDYLKKEDVQLISGGFPCQGFSLSGSRVISDPRNTLYVDMLEIVAEVKPEYILMENVLGLLTIFGGKVLNKIISDYRNLGYKISFKEINSADYEVAQTRKRVIFIANRLDKPNYYPAKIITDSKDYITCGQILEKYKNLQEDKDFNHIFSKHSDEMKKRLLEVPIGECLYEKFNDSWKKCSKYKPSCTIKGNHGATNIHYELPRVITPREMAALQSFPDDYIFMGNKHSLLTQIGNAVPPYVARAIGLALLSQLQKTK